MDHAILASLGVSPRSRILCNVVRLKSQFNRLLFSYKKPCVHHLLETFSAIVCSSIVQDHVRDTMLDESSYYIQNYPWRARHHSPIIFLIRITVTNNNHNRSRFHTAFATAGAALQKFDHGVVMGAFEEELALEVEHLSLLRSSECANNGFEDVAATLVIDQLDKFDTAA